MILCNWVTVTTIGSYYSVMDAFIFSANDKLWVQSNRSLARLLLSFPFNSDRPSSFSPKKPNDGSRRHCLYFILFCSRPPFDVLLRALNRLRPLWLFDLCNKPRTVAPNNIILRMSAAKLTPLNSMSHFVWHVFVDYETPGCCVTSGVIYFIALKQ